MKVQSNKAIRWSIASELLPCVKKARRESLCCRFLLRLSESQQAGREDR
jgi:hypothetical protein